MAAPPHFGTPLTRFVARKQFRLRSQWRSPHGGAAPFRHTRHTLRGPMGSSTEGASGAVLWCWVL
eukprot:5610583-Pyramimonas_sp.AAC.1